MDNSLANTIREKIDIVDIIGERLPLTKKGKNYWGICPFHDDNNPSMSVSRDKQIYKCFSCGAAGNVFNFIMNYDHMDFRDALVYLGNRCGVDVKGVKKSSSNTKFTKMYEAYDISLKYFVNNLNSGAGKKAREYLKNRKIDDKLIKKYEIGLSLANSNDLTNLLTKKSYDISMINEIGLSNDKHDVYNDRIMFPLHDTYGKCVGFSGRIYDSSSDSKYVNTKESPIFKKGEMLYNYHRVKEECRKKNYVIVMEGFMDVIRASSVGINNCVALMGTSMTKEQLNLIKRLSSNIILCLDGDDAGVNATLKNGELFLNEGIEVKVINLPNPDDPDTYILNNGKDKFLSLIDNSILFNDFKLAKLKENVNFNKVSEKSDYINAVLKELAKSDDDIRIEIVLKDLEKEYNIGYNTLELQLEKYKKKTNKKEVVVPEKKVVFKKKSKYEKAVCAIIYYMLNNDWVIDEVKKAKLNILDNNYRITVTEIIYYYDTNGYINVADFYTYISDREDTKNIVDEVINIKMPDVITKDELKDYFEVVRSYCKKKEIERLNDLISKEVDPLEQAKLADKIRKLRMGDE